MIAKTERRKLTTGNVRALRAADHGEHYLVRDRDLPGFYVYRGSQSCTYYAEADYRDAHGRKKTKRVKIGSAFLMDEPEARMRAMGELSKNKLGGYANVAPKPKTGDATLRAAYEFMLSRKELAPDTLRSYRKSFVTEAAPLRDLMDARLADLTMEASQQDLERRYHELAERAPYLANRVFQNLRTVYGFARKRRWRWLPAEGPTELIEYKKEKRYKVEKGVDHNSIWAAIDECGDPVTKSLWIATLLTGARPGEISRIRWPDVDLDNRTVLLRNTKTMDEFWYVLSDRLRDLIDNCRYDDEFVFFGRHKKYRDVDNVDLLPLPLGKFRNIYMAVAKRINVGDLHLKMLVGHKVETDVTHGYAEQFEIQLPRLIEEQEKITAALSS